LTRALFELGDNERSQRALLGFHSFALMLLAAPIADRMGARPPISNSQG